MNKAIGGTSSRSTHCHGRSVVTIHDTDTHARAFWKTIHVDQILLLQVNVVVTESRQRRGILTRIQRRLDNIAKHNAGVPRAIGISERNSGSCNNCNDQCATCDLAAQVDTALRAALSGLPQRRGGIRCGCPTDTNIQAGLESTVLICPCTPTQGKCPPCGDQPNIRESTALTPSNADNSHNGNGNNRSNCTPSAKDQ